MSWLPEHWDVLTIAAVVIAALGGLVGIAAGVQGFTATASARRVIAWTTEALAHKDTSGRVTTLKDARSRAEARLLALHLVRWWRFAEVAVFLVLWAPVLVLAFGKSPGWSSIAGPASLVVVTIVQPIRRAIRTYCERIRIEHEYIDGAHPVDRPQLGMLSLMEGGTRREWHLSGAAAIEFAAVVAGIALLASGKSTWWGLIVGATGAGSFIFWLRAVNHYARGLAAKTTATRSAVN